MKKQLRTGIIIAILGLLNGIVQMLGPPGPLRVPGLVFSLLMVASGVAAALQAYFRRGPSPPELTDQQKASRIRWLLPLMIVTVLGLEAWNWSNGAPGSTVLISGVASIGLLGGLLLLIRRRMLRQIQPQLKTTDPTE